VARPSETAGAVLAVIVLSHTAVCAVHGAAHVLAHVRTTPFIQLYIAIVIVVGPLAGLLLARRRPVAGGWIVAATMTGALVFGGINHFIIPGPDHVTRVAPEWQRLFASSAALLVITEIAGSAVGVWYATRRRKSSS
jgi:hypothetical protein